MTGNHPLDNTANLHDAIAECFQSVAKHPSARHWCVALSGGPDSTALLHALAALAPHHNARLTALIVNHNLRAEARDEAEAVAKQCDEHDIDAVILTVTAQPPKTAIQEWARDNRYALLCAYARAHTGMLWLAHHHGDQVETTAMRLAHDSGLLGLSAMTPVSQRQDVIMLRPYLYLSKQALIDYCHDRDLSFISDPSNHKQQFERVRWRNLLLSEPELSTALGSLSQLASRYRSVIDTSISAFIAQAAHWGNDHLTLHLRRDAVLQLSKSAQIHLFRQLIGFMGHAQYRPSFDAVSRLLAPLPEQGQVTLGRTIIKFRTSLIDILPEAGRPHDPILLKAGDNIVYQGRFIVKSSHDCQLLPMSQSRLSAFSEDNQYRAALMAYPPELRMIFPYPSALDERPVTTHIKTNMLECDMVSSDAAQPLVLIKPIYDAMAQFSKDASSHR